MSAILRRGFLVPWIFSALVMYVLSYLWHGIFLTDLEELTIPLGLYFVLAAIVYLAIGFALTLFVDQALLHGWIELKSGFPIVSFLFAGVLGFLLYLLVFVLGISFSASEAKHVLVDILWQVAEQGIGGACVALGIIHDMRRTQVEMEGG